MADGTLKTPGSYKTCGSKCRIRARLALLSGDVGSRSEAALMYKRGHTTANVRVKNKTLLETPDPQLDTKVNINVLTFIQITAQSSPFHSATTFKLTREFVPRLSCSLRWRGRLSPEQLLLHRWQPARVWRSRFRFPLRAAQRDFMT